MYHVTDSQIYKTLTMALDGLEKRQKLLANNVANMNTAGFTARDLDFNRVMQDAQSTITEPDLQMEPSMTDEGHLSSVLERDNDVWDFAVLHLGAPPVLQDQMVKLSTNTLQYSAVAQALGQQLARYRQVIHEGRR
ncbi:MAG: hypothetical protein FJX76_18960 [Armatimonadetes bacterium]|nr:hypothetical protein [Armatimonadota bacterium]